MHLRAQIAIVARIRPATGRERLRRSCGDQVRIAVQALTPSRRHIERRSSAGNDLDRRGPAPAETVNVVLMGDAAVTLK